MICEINQQISTTFFFSPYTPEIIIAPAVKVGQGEPIKTLRKTYGTPTEATQAANAELKALARGELHGSLTLIGNPKLVAEGVLNIEGVTGFVDGKYIAKRVEHEISGSGYRCRVDIELGKATSKGW
ncbi:hypothetical protein [Algicola sagamiensis]|uniref:hypothetical protein n=1 Tax=Algicola sagamiensis TaxID=163869 RepID=UPI000375625D|nr:hypothetical protein [Algicola sagamiensis]